MVTKHTHTRLFTISFHLNLPVCVYVWEGERNFPFGISTFPFPPLPLFVQPYWLIYLSLLSQTQERSLWMWSRLPPRCVHKPTPMNPCSLWIFLFPSLSLASPSLPHASLSSSARAQEKAPRLQGGSVKRPAPSVTSSAVVLCHSAWGLPLKPKAALEDASDGFCPLFHSPTFIPLRRGRHQGRFLTSMLFRQWCHCHGDVVLCLRPCINGEEKHRI